LCEFIAFDIDEKFTANTFRNPLSNCVRETEIRHRAARMKNAAAPMAADSNLR